MPTASDRAKHGTGRLCARINCGKLKVSDRYLCFVLAIAIPKLEQEYGRAIIAI